MKELRKLNRKELLEILLSTKEENETLKKENEELKSKLESREIILSEAGSIAQAALKLNGVFQAAQDAAEQYVENVRRIADERLKKSIENDKESSKGSEKQ